MRKGIRYIKYISLFLIVVGLSMLGGFYLRRHLDRREQLRIQAAYEERLRKLGVQEIDDHHYAGYSDHEPEAASRVYEKGDTIAVLTLERLGIKVAVTEGIDKAALRVSAGHFSSDLPGEGNFAIAGHSSRIYTCLFNDMHKAVVGDEIKVYTETGRHDYIITGISVAEPGDIDVISHQNESVITIVTCTNDGAERLVIRGIETSL